MDTTSSQAETSGRDDLEVDPADIVVHDPAEVSGVSPDGLRRAMSHFASGVTVVTAVLDGMLQAMTATAFSSVSLEPPLCLICVGKASRFHVSVLHADRWAVSILAADQEDLARHFAYSGRDLSTQFEGVPHEFAPTSGAPLIAGAAAWIDCLTVARHDAGDHTIVVGEIVWVADSDAEGERRPLTYHRGTYHRL